MLLKIKMLVGGIIAVFLDNTVPGIYLNIEFQLKYKFRRHERAKGFNRKAI